MSPKKAIIILTVIAVILIMVFILIFFWQNGWLKLMQRKFDQTNSLDQKPLTEAEKKQLMLDTLNKTSTPDKSGIQSTESILDALNKAESAGLNKTERNKQTQQMLDTLNN